jgi:hypothetical protein
LYSWGAEIIGTPWEDYLVLGAKALARQIAEESLSVVMSITAAPRRPVPTPITAVVMCRLLRRKALVAAFHVVVITRSQGGVDDSALLVMIRTFRAHLSVLPCDS